MKEFLMGEYPLISIIVPFYNSGKLIANSVNSLKKQKEKNFEVIFINDGSRDNSRDILRELLEDCNFTYRFIDKENEGVSIARNLGIKEAKGNYIIFLDADDAIHEDLIKELNKKLKDSEPFDIVYWGWDKVDPSGKVIGKYEDHYEYIKNSNSFIKDYMLHNFWIWTGSAMYNKDFLINNNIFFLKKVFFAEDVNFIFKALLKANHITCIEKSLSYYFFHGQSISKNFNFKRVHTIKAIYLLEILLKDGTEEKEIFINEFKPEFYWNMINGLLLFDKNDEKTKDIVIRLIKNNFIRKELKKYKFKSLKGKIRKMIILYFPSMYISIFK
ncbi:glycosyltransferase [Petrotoga sp. DB-2]